jgi:hypothetical protein
MTVVTIVKILCVGIVMLLCVGMVVVIDDLVGGSIACGRRACG